MASCFANNVMGDYSIDQRKYVQRHPSSNIQLVTFSFVDLHLNTSMLFAMSRCELTALEPQSTKQYDTSPSKLTPNAAKSTFAGRMPFLVTDASHTVRSTSVHHIYHILGRGTKDGEVCFSSSVYIANVRFAFTNRSTVHTQHKTHEDGGKYTKIYADLKQHRDSTNNWRT